MRGTVLAVVLVAAAAAGCLGPVGQQPADCGPVAYGEVLRPSGVWPHTFNAGEPSDLLYLGTSPQGTRLEVAATDGNESYSQEAPVYGDGKPVEVGDVRFTRGEGPFHFGAVRVSPADADPGVVLDFRLHALDMPADCDDSAGSLTINWGAFQNEVPARAAEPGQGAHVWYAGFWENGTLFDTNMQGLDVGSGWPKAGWYEGGHWDPIPVYVYDQDRSEQPPHWKSPFSGTPAAGSPTDEQLGAGYFTTIKGFNEAVKGLPVGTRQVFHLAPEDAYTLPGREDHPLYGDALVFYVEVRDVVDVPCPAPPGVGDACSRLSQRVPSVVAA